MITIFGFTVSSIGLVSIVAYVAIAVAVSNHLVNYLVNHRIEPQRNPRFSKFLVFNGVFFFVSIPFWAIFFSGYGIVHTVRFIKEWYFH